MTDKRLLPWGCPMRRIGWIVLAAAVVAASASARGAAPPPPTKFNVDCEVGWQGCFRPLDWTPVHFRFDSSSQERAEYTLQVSGEESDQAAMTVSRTIVLNPGDSLPVPLAARIGNNSFSCRARLVDANKREVWQKEYDFSGATRTSLVQVSMSDCLIGVHRFLSKGDRLDFGLHDLPKNTYSRLTPAVVGDANQGGQMYGQVYVKERMQKDLPDDWTGYDSLDLLVLYDPDWTVITPLQSEAIRQWVSGGGRLMIILGSTPLPVTHPLAGMLPLSVGLQREVPLGVATREDWGFAGTGRVAVKAWALEEKGAWGWTLSDDGLWACGPVGLGKVGVLAFDPAEFGPRISSDDSRNPSAMAEAARRSVAYAGFWTKRANQLMAVRALETGKAPQSDNSSYYGVDSGSSTNTIMAWLLNIREMRPISIIWIVMLLLGLAVVIGPFDYLILKRRDRLPLTWMTFTIYIVAFSVLAYYGVKALRSGPTQLRAMAVVDAVEGDPYAWGACYSGIFANESDNYPLSGLRDKKTGKILRKEWWSTLAPHWSHGFSDDQGPLRQMQQGLSCLQEDGANLPAQVPINIWSMQCLMAEGQAPAALISARVERSGDGLTVRVTNLSGADIKHGYVRFKEDRAMVLGDVPAHETREFKGRLGSATTSWRPANNNNGYGMFESHGEMDVSEPPIEAMYTAPGTVRRTRAMIEQMREGAAVVVVEFQDAPCPYGIENHRFTAAYTQCARLVVIPTEKKP
jgi:hypothetical protein